MSEQSPLPRRSRRDFIGGTLQRFNSSREQRVLGPAEIVGLGGSIVILLLVVVSYLYFLMPAKARLEARQSERATLKSQLRNSQEVVLQGESPRQAFKKSRRVLMGLKVINCWAPIAAAWNSTTVLTY